MQNLPVHWYEGLFLRPQHLQAADRYWSEATRKSQQWDSPYFYGLHSIEFSREALGNHQFEVYELRARMRDGTLVSLEAGQEPDRINVKEAVKQAQASTRLAEAFDSTAIVTVFLGVPRLRMGRANVGNGELAADARYRETELAVQDESRGGNDQRIQFRQLNARLLLSTDDLSGYELLPIARIERATDREASPQLDETYIPPVLSTNAWPQLNRLFVRDINDMIGKKIEVLAAQIKNRHIGLDARDPGDAERILMLSQLNAAYGALAVLSFAQGIHPLSAYLELCRVLGQLSIFGPSRRTEDVPAYDHEDLYRVFYEIRRRIEALINAVRDYEYEQRYFLGVGLGMQVSLVPKWFNADWQWYVGVNKGELTVQECRDLLAPGELDWKLGSSRQVEMIFTKRMPGVDLIPVERQIRALPSRSEWLYFEIPRRDSPAWRDVQETQSLAMRLKDSLILNRDRLQGESRMVVSYKGRKVPVEFALFAVPAL
ncbi:MAG: type VI secretion system baseplate subunit TssK [Pirellulaceae bacterium]|nr:type VI secretion system baseplate subunit TssK [Pirellulaceae bacterium]